MVQNGNRQKAHWDEARLDRGPQLGDRRSGGWGLCEKAFLDVREGHQYEIWGAFSKFI